MNVKKILTKLFILLIIFLLWLKCYSIISSDKNYDKGTYEAIPKENVCVSLNYHRVKDKTLWDEVLMKTLEPDELIHYTVFTDEFESQIDTLIANNVHFLTLQEFEECRISGQFPNKSVLLTFDDADDTIYKNVYPILKKKQIPFTVFVIAGQINNKDFNNLKMATWDELREMQSSNLVSFGSHTFDMHYLEDNKAEFLEEKNYKEFGEDIKKSQEVLKKELGVEISSIAYPFGNASDEITNLAKESGFKEGFILAPHPITADDDSYYLNRYMIDRYNFDKILIPWLEDNK